MGLRVHWCWALPFHVFVCFLPWCRAFPLWRAHLLGVRERLPSVVPPPPVCISFSGFRPGNALALFGRALLLDFWGLVLSTASPPGCLLGPRERLRLAALLCLVFSDFCPGPRLPFWLARRLGSWVGVSSSAPHGCLLVPRVRLPLTAFPCLFFSGFLSGATLAFGSCAPSGLPDWRFVFAPPPRLGPGVRLTLTAVFCLFFSAFCPGPHLPLWRAPLLDSWVARRLPSPRVCLLYPRGRLPLPAVTCLVFSDFLSGPTLAFIWCAPSGRLCRDGCFCVSTQWDTFLCSLCFSGPPFRPWALSEFWAVNVPVPRRRPAPSWILRGYFGRLWALGPLPLFPLRSGFQWDPLFGCSSPLLEGRRASGSVSVLRLPGHHRLRLVLPLVSDGDGARAPSCSAFVRGSGVACSAHRLWGWCSSLACSGSLDFSPQALFSAPAGPSWPVSVASVSSYLCRVFLSALPVFPGAARGPRTLGILGASAFAAFVFTISFGDVLGLLRGAPPPFSVLLSRGC